MVQAVVREVMDAHPEIDDYQLTHETIRRLIHRMVVDVMAQTQENIRHHKVQTVEDIRALGQPLVVFSDEMQVHNKELKDFLMKHMYRHYKVNRMTSKARRLVKELFTFS